MPWTDDERRTILHVGCGTQDRKALPPFNFETEWREVRLDIDPSVNPDIVASIVDLDGVPDDSVDIVFSKHNLEHVWEHEVGLVLSSFYRVLKPKGFAIIRVPDLMAAARLMVERGLDTTIYVATVGGRDMPVRPIDMIYGWAQPIAEGNPFMTHKTGFTEDTLRRHVLAAGFEDLAMTTRPEFNELGVFAYKEAADNLRFELEAR